MNLRLLLFASIFSHALTTSAALAAWNANGNPASINTGVKYSGGACGDAFQGAIVAWNVQDWPATSGTIFAQRVSEAGIMQWTSTGVEVTPFGYTYERPTAVPDETGGAFIAYSGNGVDIGVQHVSSTGQMLWSTFGITVCQAPNWQYGAKIIPDGAGGAIAAWTDNRSDYQGDVYAQRINAAGEVQWAVDGVAVSNTTQLETMSSMLPDGAGGAFIAYDRQNDVFAQRINANGIRQWASGGVPISLADNEQDHPQIALDGAGGIIATWDDIRGGSGYEVYAQRISGSGNPQWTIDGVVVKNPIPAGVPNSPQIASDEAGGAIIAWIDGAADGSPASLGSCVVRAQKVNASGALQWPATGGVPVTSPNYVGRLVMEADGSGGAFMAWERGQSGNDGIHAMHISPAGQLIWPMDGIAVGSVNSVANYPAIVRSGDGAIVTWTSKQDYQNSTVLAQRIGGSITDVHDTPRPAWVTVGDFMPNPFSSSTSIDITMKRASNVTIEVFDVAGRLVRHRAMGVIGTGTSRITLDGVEDYSHPLASGVYFCRIHAGGEAVTRKMVITR